MKNLIYCLVVFICVQTIHANKKVKTCENDLSILKAEAAAFFTKFKAEHDIAHQDVEAIRGAVNQLGSSLDAFASTNFGADFDLITFQCIIKSFVDGFKVICAITQNNLDHLQDEIDKLLDMASEFRYSHDLACDDCHCHQSTGCKAELNKLRCDLEEFFKSLKAAGSKARTDVRRISDATKDLSRVEKKFSSLYQLKCGLALVPNSGTLKNDVTTFYTKFRKPYEAGNVYFIELQGICDTLIKAIDQWQIRLGF